MHIQFLSRWRYTHTITWALLMSSLIVAIAATMARATLRLRGAMSSEDASLAVMLLLPEKNISDVTMIKAGYDTQEFLAQTESGPEVIRVKKFEGEWIVTEEVPLRE
jgi:hypothetical protein